MLASNKLTLHLARSAWLWAALAGCGRPITEIVDDELAQVDRPGDPLLGGDADWSKAPITEPGKDGVPHDPSDSLGGNSGGEGGAGDGAQSNGDGDDDGWDGDGDDDLMDRVTDAGKGAYVFIDGADEATRMFGNSERFTANIAIAARNLQMELRMPWYFGVKEFHGEDISPHAEEVDPQHLGPNDAMSFHQIVGACDPSLPLRGDLIRATARWSDPESGEDKAHHVEIALANLVEADATQLFKGDVVVAYAKAFVNISGWVAQGDHAAARETARAMAQWLQDAATRLADHEVGEMADTMSRYAEVI